MVLSVGYNWMEGYQLKIIEGNGVINHVINGRCSLRVLEFSQSNNTFKLG